MGTRSTDEAQLESFTYEGTVSGGPVSIQVLISNTQENLTRGQDMWNLQLTVQNPFTVDPKLIVKIMLQNITKVLFMYFLFFVVGCNTVHHKKSQKKDFDPSIEELIQKAENITDGKGYKQELWKWYRITTEGEKWLEGLLNFKDDKKNGKCIRLYQSKNIYTIRNYKMDVLDGYSIVYRPNGTIHYEETYRSGKLHGIKKWYSLTGVHESDQEWRDGIPHGVVRHYYISGNLLSESYEENGVEEGGRIIYSDSVEKEIIKKYEFVKGVKVSAKYYRNGKLIKEEKF